jgi:RNA polymerase sigma-70 factor (ECF subfamily)
MSSDYEFEKIYNDFFPKILQYVTRMAGQNDAEDITQNVFDKINRGLEGFQENSRLSTWIYRIATNTIIDMSRSAAYKNAAVHTPMEDDADHAPRVMAKDSRPPSTDQLVIRKEMNECIKEHIDKLPHDYKTVIVLSELEGMANKDIAEIMDISLDNVKIRLHRARARLKALLNEACDFYYTDDNTLACDRKQVCILPKPPK